MSDVQDCSGEASLPAHVDQRLLRTAVHEAGHVIVAFAVGIGVESASIKPDAWSLGRVGTTALRPPAQDDAHPRSVRVAAELLTSMAGDRAVRRSWPFRPTCAGGLDSDLAQTHAILRAVCDRDAIEAELFRHRDALDGFFARPDIADQMALVVRLLLERRTVRGSELRDVLLDGRCGALDPVTDRRCDGQPHIAGDHSIRVRTAGSFDVRWDEWPGFSLDRLPVKARDRSRTWIALNKALTSDLRPSPKNRGVYEAGELAAKLRDPNLSTRKRAAALKAIAAELSSIAAKADPLEPPTEFRTPTAPVEAHDERCSRAAERLFDGWFCGCCGFESLDVGARRDGWHYGVAHVCERGGETPSVSSEPVTRWVLDSAHEAAQLLRFVELTTDGIYRVVLFPPTLPSASGAATTGRNGTGGDDDHTVDTSSTEAPPAPNEPGVGWVVELLRNGLREAGVEVLGCVDPAVTFGTAAADLILSRQQSIEVCLDDDRTFWLLVGEPLGPIWESGPNAAAASDAEEAFICADEVDRLISDVLVYLEATIERGPSASPPPGLVVEPDRHYRNFIVRFRTGMLVQLVADLPI